MLHTYGTALVLVVLWKADIQVWLQNKQGQTRSEMNCIWTSCGELVNTITCCDIHFTCTEILLQVARNGNVRFCWLCLSQQLSVLLSGIKRTDKIHCCVPRFMSFESVGLVNTNSLAMALVHCISQYQSVSQSVRINYLSDWFSEVFAKTYSNQ